MTEGNDCPSAEEMIDNFIEECEREAAKLEITVELKGEKYKISI